jgi:hypothetical protein
MPGNLERMIRIYQKPGHLDLGHLDLGHYPGVRETYVHIDGTHTDVVHLRLLYRFVHVYQETHLFYRFSRDGITIYSSRTIRDWFVIPSLQTDDLKIAVKFFDDLISIHHIHST